MSLERPSSLSELARLGFEELSATVPRLEELVHLVGDVGRKSLAYLGMSPSPDASLIWLSRLAETNPKIVAKALAKESVGIRLCKLFGASEAIASHIIRFPYLVDEVASVRSFPTRQDCLQRFEQSIDPAVQNAGDLLRIEYRNLITLIATLDLEHVDPRDSFQSVSEALSDLASATVEFALRIARAEFQGVSKYEEAFTCTQLAIIGMGKCGARELNYISDVDVIFAYEGAHELSMEFATKLATRTMRIIDSQGVETPLWEVDPNLRPEGRNGALVRSIESHVAYYNRWAENWEFQALLKARPIAGDVKLGERYVREVQSLIWSNLRRSTLVESVRNMRTRVLENIPAAERERQLKLGRGGLRDVEFTAQLLQLVHGYEDESLRVASTISALEALATAGFLGRDDAKTFAHSYRTLRSIEHRIQLAQLRRTHLIPTSQSEQRRVARAFGSGVDLTELWDHTRTTVAALHDSVFYRPLLNAMANLEAGEVKLTDTEVKARLTALGFKDSEGAMQHISALTTGVSRRSTIQRTLLPVLLRWLAEGVNPDRGLLSFRRLSEELGETPWFLRMLRDSAGAAESLMLILSSSDMIATLLEISPESAAWLDDDANLLPRTRDALVMEFSALLNRGAGDAQSAEGVRYIRRREMLRLAIAALLEKITFFDLAEALSDLADSYLDAMLTLAYQIRGVERALAPIEVIAMGRYGGREIGFGSDADVILVRADFDDSQSSDLLKLSENVVSEFKLLVKDALIPFELDFDLRPEGKNGPVLRSLKGYAAYYEKWAEPWEYQALLKARPLNPASELAASFLAIIDSYRYPSDLSAKAVIEIRRIKARVEQERLPQGADPLRHLKLGRGSLSDVEWLIQLIQLKHSHQHGGLQTTSTLRALGVAAELGLIGGRDHEILRSAWLLSSRIRTAIVLASGKQLDILPTDRGLLEAVARILEYRPMQASELEEDYLAVTRKSRRVFESLFLA